MFIKKDTEHIDYNLLNDSIKRMRIQHELNFSFALETLIKQFGVTRIIKTCVMSTVQKRLMRLSGKKFVPKAYELPEYKSEKRNFFTNGRIVAYTCITGGYDAPLEPFLTPDNVDYYVITDGLTPLPKNTVYKTIDINSLITGNNSMTNQQKARWCKIFPHKVFKNYEYSVWFDGNVQPVIDISEFTNILGRAGLGIHWHEVRDCVYDEADVCIRLKKANKTQILQYVKRLRKAGFLEHYGLVNTSILVRNHKNTLCTKIMSEWWNELINGVPRDQISLPFILWRNGVEVKEVAILGKSALRNPSFRVVRHAKYRIGI